MSTFLSSTNWYLAFSYSHSVNENWLTFKRILFSAIEKYLPKYYMRCRKRSFVPKDTKKAIDKKKLFWRSYK